MKGIRQRRSLGLTNEGPSLTWIRVEGAVIRAPSSHPEGYGEGWPVGPWAWVEACAHVERGLYILVVEWEGGEWASLLQICIPADFYFKPCLFLLKTWLLCQESYSN